MSWPSDKDKALLEANGWEVECCSPFEIRTKDGSFATGEAADYVLMGLREEADPTVQLTFEEVRVCIKALNSMQTILTLQNCSRDFGSEEFFEKLLAKFYAAHAEGIEKWEQKHPRNVTPPSL